MTRAEALDRAQPLTAYGIRTATGADGETWYVSRRVGDGTEDTVRLE